MLLKHQNIPFLTLDFSKQNCSSTNLSNVITLPQPHRRDNLFVNKSIGEMISQGYNAFACNIMQTNQGPDRLCQVKSHVQTACESYDLNMDFYGFKHLRVMNSYAKILLQCVCTLVPLPHGTMGWSLICDCGISWSYSLILYRGSYRSAHVLLNLLNKLRKSHKMRSLPSILSLFRNAFNKFNDTRARMLDSIYQMTLRIL